MRTTILIMCLLLIPAFAFADVNLDISSCTTEIIDSNTIRLNKVTGSVDGVSVPGQYWIEFEWDPVGLVFVPADIGQEPVPTSKTWSWTVSEYGGSYRFTLTSHPETRTFDVYYQQISGSPLICPTFQDVFIQGDNQFGVRETFIDNSTALITYLSTFSGCSDIYTGQTVTAKISEIPSWFDFTKAFKVSLLIGLEELVMVCEPDGTVHK